MTGFPFQELREHGFKVTELAEVCSPSELVAEGFSLGELLDLNFGICDLKDSGCFAADDFRGYVSSEGEKITPSDLKKSGYVAAQLRKIGYTRDELIEGSVFTESELSPHFSHSSFSSWSSSSDGYAVKEAKLHSPGPASPATARASRYVGMDVAI